jgi:hypothetical protein
MQVSARLGHGVGVDVRALVQAGRRGTGAPGYGLWR